MSCWLWRTIAHWQIIVQGLSKVQIIEINNLEVHHLSYSWTFWKPSNNFENFSGMVNYIYFFLILGPKTSSSKIYFFSLFYNHFSLSCSLCWKISKNFLILQFLWLAYDAAYSPNVFIKFWWISAESFILIRI